MADIVTKQFAPSDILLTIGALPITGYFDGTFITLTFPNNLFERKEGADGGIVFVKNETGLLSELEFVLLQTSQTNTALSAEVLAVYERGILLPITLRDINGETILSAARCAPAKMPDVTFEKDTAAGRTWRFILPKTIGIVGGSL